MLQNRKLYTVIYSHVFWGEKTCFFTISLGLWIDLEMSYNGSFLMTLETKMNLTKLGKEPLVEALKVGEIGKEG